MDINSYNDDDVKLDIKPYKWKPLSFNKNNAVHQPSILPPDVIVYLMTNFLNLNGLLKAATVCMLTSAANHFLAITITALLLQYKNTIVIITATITSLEVLHGSSRHTNHYTYTPSPSPPHGNIPSHPHGH